MQREPLAIIMFVVAIAATAALILIAQWADMDFGQALVAVTSVLALLTAGTKVARDRVTPWVPEEDQT